LFPLFLTYNGISFYKDKCTAAYFKVRWEKYSATETLYPFKNALCVEAKVMLLKNIVVEHKLTNGSIRHVKTVCYLHPAGPKLNNDNDI
jgi:hypothetical protein